MSGINCRRIAKATGEIEMNQNLKSWLVPPVEASDGFASQPEPEKGLAEILAEEASSVRSAAFQDVLTYSVDNEINGANHDLRTILNVRHNLPWKTIAQIIERATPFIKPAIQKALAERDASEAQRVKFQTLAALFTEPVRVQKNEDTSKYDLLGLTDDQIRLCADALAIEGTDE
jgi:hypothetical protein